METLLPFLPALAAGALITITHVPLGQEVLRRGIIFLDLAIAQTAALGALIAAFVWDTHHHPFKVQAAAVSMALLCAYGLHKTGKKWPDLQEALIGSLFVFTATLAILVLHFMPQGAEHLKDLLVGQILWTGWTQFFNVGVIYAICLPFIFKATRQQRDLLFYMMFAIVVTFSVQLVGVYLVFATLILPAIATHKSKNKLMKGITVSLLGYVAGFAASLMWDVPTGAAIVCGLVLFSLLGGIKLSSKAAPA